MDFVNLAREGKNNWWRYVLAVFTILFIWFGVSIVVFMLLFAFVLFDNNPETRPDTATGQIVGVEPLIMFVVIMLSAAALFAAVLIAVRLFHQRPARSLITPLARVDWKRIAVGFGFFFLLGMLGSIVEGLLFPGRYQLTFKPDEFFKFVPFVLILIPIQTTGEELLFRAYLLQSFGLLFRRPFIAAVVSSFIFMSLHLANPEVSADAILLPAYYFCVGMLFSLVTLKDGRLELALGAHAAVNIFSALGANYTVSALATPSLFTVTTLDAGFSFAAFVITAIVFYAGLFWRRPIQRA